MEILHLKPSDYKTNQWSGGTTTELLIWPRGASYASREFTLRISSATVDLPESDFTPLPGVTRYITPLEGSFTLTHPGCKPVHLGPLAAPYRFSGETPTHCQGTATDFNLMLKGVAGEMCLCQAHAPLRPGLNGIYALQSCTIRLDDQCFSMCSGELLVILCQETGSLLLEDATAICCWAAI